MIFEIDGFRFLYTTEDERRKQAEKEQSASLRICGGYIRLDGGFTIPKEYAKILTKLSTQDES